MANVEEAYHNLVLARTTVDIQQRLLLATEDTYKRMHDRILVDADQISVNQEIAAVEQRQAELINDRIQLRAASDNLKVLMNDPEISINENALINPTDKPIVPLLGHLVGGSRATAFAARIGGLAPCS